MVKKIVVSTLLASSLLANNLDFLVQNAIENRLVEASKNSLEASKLEYESVKNSYKPNLFLNSRYSNVDNESFSVAKNSLTSSLSLNYSLYDGGKKQNSFDALKSNIKNKDLNLKDLKNQISLNVISLYFNFLSLNEAKKAKIQEVKQLKSQYKKLEKFYETGTIAIDELEKILSRLENANVSIQEIELDKQTILHNLEYIVGEKVDILSGGNIKNLSDKNSKLRADIKALEYQIKSAKSNAKIVKSSNYPQLSFNNTFTHKENDFDNKLYDSKVDNQNVLSLNLSWKLYDFKAVDKSYESAMKKYLALKSQYEYEKNRMDVDLRLAYKSYNIAKLKIKSAQASLKSANATFRAIKDKYENNLVDNVAFLEALSEKSNALSILKRSQNDLQIKRANIIYHSGYDLKDFIK